jgi:DNA-binding MarR family transcriptional regulator
MERPSVHSELLPATRDCACLAARRHARLLTRHFDEHLRPHGLRSTQFSVLAALAQTGPIALGDLAELLGLERTTLTRSAGILGDRGWVATVPTADARKRPLRITPAGRGRLARALPAWHRAQQEAGLLSAGPVVPDR